MCRKCQANQEYIVKPCLHKATSQCVCEMSSALLRLQKPKQQMQVEWSDKDSIVHENKRWLSHLGRQTADQYLRKLNIQRLLAILPLYISPGALDVGSNPVGL